MALGGYAFTAANTVPSTKAGDGAGSISGFATSSVSYTLNATNTRNLDSIGFNVDVVPAAGSAIKIKLSVAGSTWYTCTNVSTAITCPTTSPQATVAGVDELRVVIVE